MIETQILHDSRMKIRNPRAKDPIIGFNGKNESYGKHKECTIYDIHSYDVSVLSCRVVL